VLSLKQESDAGSGAFLVELRNDGGQYSALPESLQSGCELHLSPGYLTSAGRETSAGQSFKITGYEYRVSGGKSSLVLYAQDVWHALQHWQARHHFRWNQYTAQKSVREILAFVLAKAGVRLEIISMSATITSFCPDFSINPGESGRAAINKLLSFVADVLFTEGNTAYLVNPQASDASCYAYGNAHAVLEGRYAQTELSPNAVRVEGRNTATGAPIAVNSFDWESVESSDDRLQVVEDINISSAAQAGARDEAVLRKAFIPSVNGLIKVLPNCGQQLYDVVEVSGTALASPRMRVAGWKLTYRPERGEYQQQLMLCGVE